MDKNQEQITDRVRDFVRSISSTHPVKEAFLFGSWAEHKAGEWSDIDIGLVLTGEGGPSVRSELYSRGKDFDVDFDVLAFSEEEFEREDAIVILEIKKKGIKVA